MTIELTDAAVAAVKQALLEEKAPAETYLRVGVRAGGCSGYSYVLAFEAAAQDEDTVIEQDGVRVLIDPQSEAILTGTTLDYSNGLNGQGFVFRNPNATGGCGCGSSFTV